MGCLNKHLARPLKPPPLARVEDRHRTARPAGAANWCGPAPTRVWRTAADSCAARAHALLAARGARIPGCEREPCSHIPLARRHDASRRVTTKRPRHSPSASDAMECPCDVHGAMPLTTTRRRATRRAVARRRCRARARRGSPGHYEITLRSHCISCHVHRTDGSPGHYEITLRAHYISIHDMYIALKARAARYKAWRVRTTTASNRRRGARASRLVSDAARIHIALHCIASRCLPFYSTPFHSTSFHSIPFHSIPFHSIPFHSTPLHSTPFHSISISISILFPLPAAPRASSSPPLRRRREGQGVQGGGC